MKEKKDIIFASDLDNTLLRSRRYKRAGDICVEHLQGEEQGFMTPITVERLRAVCQKMHFIPVTTRSVEQYKRVKWPKGTEPIYAVTTNGAVLLQEGKEDAKWQKAHFDTIALAREEIARCYALYADDPRFIRCRIVDGSYLFCYAADGIDVQIAASKCQAATSLRVEPSGRKIYFFPQGLTKGAALLALSKRFLARKIYAAGDSVIDVPLLLFADHAFAGADLAIKDAAHIRSHSGKGIFAEWLLAEILHLVATSN